MGVGYAVAQRSGRTVSMLRCKEYFTTEFTDFGELSRAESTEPKTETERKKRGQR